MNPIVDYVKFKPALEEALEHLVPEGEDPRPPWMTRHQQSVYIAARKLLALLPDECPVPVDRFGFCSVCKNTGKVYPPDTVELIGVVLYNTDVRRNPFLSWMQLQESTKAFYRESAFYILDALHPDVS